MPENSPQVASVKQETLTAREEREKRREQERDEALAKKTVKRDTFERHVRRAEKAATTALEEGFAAGSGGVKAPLTMNAGIRQKARVRVGQERRSET